MLIHMLDRLLYQHLVQQLLVLQRRLHMLVLQVYYKEIEGLLEYYTSEEI